ncbi:unnamed protein product, partial [Scytosiphon promiscuus]
GVGYGDGGGGGVERRPRAKEKRGGRRGAGRREGRSVPGGFDESPEPRSAGRRGSELMLSSESDGGGGVGYGYDDGVGDEDNGDGFGRSGRRGAAYGRESEEVARPREGREAKEGGGEETRARRDRARSEASSVTSDGDGEKEGLLWEGTKARAREDHREAMESVSSDALRMRAIKDDLSEVLQRLRAGDIASPAAAMAAAAPAAPVATKPPPPLPSSFSAVKNKRGEKAEEEELAAAFSSTTALRRGRGDTR